MRPHEELELKWGLWAGYPRENVVACSSGTAALHLAFEGLKGRHFTDVLMGDYNMIACPRAVVMAGLKPWFVDCDDRLLIDASMTEDENPSFRLFLNLEWDGTNQPGRGLAAAVLATHIYGRRCDMSNLGVYCKRHHTHLVEDLAEGHGIHPSADTDAACWSLYANKIVTSGEEGGIVAFRNEEHATHARQLRSLGFTERHDFQHIPRGLSCRMPDSLAARAIESLSQIDTNLRIRRDIEGVYDRHCPNEWRMPPREVVWVYDLRIPGMKRDIQDRVVSTLRSSGVGARYGFKPCSLQDEFFNPCLPFNTNALRASSEVIYLPVIPGGRADEVGVKKVFDTIKGIVEEE